MRSNLNYPTLSWRNNSTQVNDPSGVAEFTYSSGYPGVIPHSFTVALSSFTDAHNLLDFLNKVTESCEAKTKETMRHLLHEVAEGWGNSK